MDGSASVSAIRLNSLKSIAIIVAFPLVLPSLLFVMSLAIAVIAGSHEGVPVAIRIFLVTLGIMGVISLFWLPIGFVLSQWILDKATGARLVSRSELRFVWAMLDRLGAKSGIRVPALRLIQTSALNAYASGLSESTYCVTVTSGLLEALEDEELEGVLAHEVTHIVHHDVRLMVVSGVLVGIVPMVHDVGMKVFWAIIMGVLGIYRAAFTLLPLPGAKALAELTYTGAYWIGRLFAYAVGFIATLCSLILQLALSRRREFMADAGAAALTGKPQALASALRKISGNATLDTAITAVRAMCIENDQVWFGLFATHPPIEDRILALSKFTTKRIEPDAAGHARRADAATLPPLATRDAGSGALDPAAVARYRTLIERAQPERLDIIGREHLYRRARETVRNAAGQKPGITMEEIALAGAYLEAAIDEIEAGLGRGVAAPTIIPRR